MNDLLPSDPALRRACMAASSGDPEGLRAFVTARIGKQWIVSECPPTQWQRDEGIEVAINHHDYADICAEFGRQRLKSFLIDQGPTP